MGVWGRVATAVVLAGLGSAGCIVGQANPANCIARVHNPHEASSRPGEISANIEVNCNPAPTRHRTELALFRSPVGQNDWERVGGANWHDGATGHLNHDLHDENIACPGGPFDYQAVGQHKYGNNLEFMSRWVLSNKVTIDC